MAFNTGLVFFGDAALKWVLSSSFWMASQSQRPQRSIGYKAGGNCFACSISSWQSWIIHNFKPLGNLIALATCFFHYWRTDVRRVVFTQAFIFLWVDRRESSWDLIVCNNKIIHLFLFKDDLSQARIPIRSCVEHQRCRIKQLADRKATGQSMAIDERVAWSPKCGRTENQRFVMVKQGQKPGQKTGISIQNTSTLTRGHMKIRVFTGLAGSLQSVQRKKVCSRCI